MKITNKHRNELLKKGWTQVDMGLTANQLNKFREGTEKLRDKAFQINYPFTLCYYPHIRSRNIAGIESPFNKLIINENVNDLFRTINLGKAIKDLMSWETVYLTLARLFTMENYKYRSQWHRDNSYWNGEVSTMGEIQVGIYLKEQNGFRIIKIDRDIWSKNNNSLSHSPKPTYIPLTINKTFYDEIKGYAGSIIFFAPGLIHQGNSNTERLDFHFRFAKFPPPIRFGEYNDNFCISNEKNDNFDFIIPKIYSYSYDINNDLYSVRNKKESSFKKILNSINYYTASVNIIRHLKNIRKSNEYKPWSIDLFSNTIFQK